MIKHRFILRGKDDFRIFAAIPVERTVLTWKKWVRPPDWAALEALLKRAQGLLVQQGDLWTAVADRYGDMAEGREVMLEKERHRLSLADIAGHTQEMLLYRARAEVISKRAETVKIDACVKTEAALTRAADRPTCDFKKMCAWLTVEAGQARDPKLPWLCGGEYEEVSAMWDNKEQQFRQYIGKRTGNRAVVELLRATSQQTIIDSYDEIRKQPWNEIVAKTIELASAVPAVLPPCPVGIPFAAYTVEFRSTVVDVIEGCAWLHEKTEEEAKHAITQIMADVPIEEHLAILGRLKTGLVDVPQSAQRILTDEEKRVVEIVTQMLTERALNPKADTRIPVVSIDPSHEHDVRAAEDRDRQVPPNETRLRTIKFQVSPPRYLRAAAERILTSTKRAHWVVGHWRDQPYGTAHQLRRRTWIKPHIRGLGEAGAITARIAAPDEKIEGPPAPEEKA